MTLRTLQPLLCPWDSPGKNTGVGRHSLLQGIFPTQGSNQGLLLCRQFFTIWATREALLDTYHSSDSLCIFRVLKYLLYREKQLLINVIKVLKLELVFINYVQNKYAKLLQSCLILCNSMHCGLPSSSVHGVFLARILEWIAILSSRGSFPPKALSCISLCLCHW